MLSPFRYIVAHACSSLAAGQQGGGGVAGSANTDAFAALDPPLVDRVLHAAFIAGGRSVATRAQLSLVSKCALALAILSTSQNRPARRLATLQQPPWQLQGSRPQTPVRM